MRLAVVKLGGSSAASATLSLWLDALQQATFPIVLVPGGGAFADSVRESQPALGFSDHAAHAMALLAMEQLGYALRERSPRFVAARADADFNAAYDRGMIPLWFPSTMVLADPQIAASWEVTSDSLAAWLARRLEAEALLLIKQTDNFSEQDNCDSLAARGIVDPAFPRFISHTALHLAGPRHASSAEHLLARGQLPGERIVTGNAMRRAV